jgi:hypothetical protein
MRINNRDKEQFADFITQRFDPQYEYNSKQKELDKDWRKEKPHMSDVLTRYSEFKDFQNSSEYENTNKATNLLSNKFDISAGELSSVLKSKYGMSDGECNQVLRNMANHRDVDMRRNLFGEDIKLKRK